MNGRNALPSSQSASHTDSDKTVGHRADEGTRVGPSAEQSLQDLLARRNDSDAVFAEPWQAQVFSMAVSLSEAGYFSWPEWVARFACEPEDAGKAYFERWLAALEGIVEERNLVKERELTYRQDAWRRAALATPHGQPIDVQQHLTVGDGHASS